MQDFTPKGLISSSFENTDIDETRNLHAFSGIQKFAGVFITRILYDSDVSLVTLTLSISVLSSWDII